MKRYLVGAIAIFALAASLPVLQAGAARHPAPVATATPLPPEDPAITLIARKQFVAWQSGSVKRELYSDQMNALMDPKLVNDTSKGLAQLGGLLQTVWAGPAVPASLPPGSKAYLYHMICSNGSVYMEFAIDPTGKFGSMLFRENLSDF
jgi:hypothetical protein